MFRRSRRKIILSIMGSLILLFAMTLAVILLASFGEIRHKNVEMLERYVAEYSLDENGVLFKKTVFIICILANKMLSLCLIRFMKKV